jgi:hypothetical protein
VAQITVAIDEMYDDEAEEWVPPEVELVRCFEPKCGWWHDGRDEEDVAILALMQRVVEGRPNLGVLDDTLSCHAIWVLCVGFEDALEDVFQAFAVSPFCRCGNSILPW